MTDNSSSNSTENTLTDKATHEAEQQVRKLIETVNDALDDLKAVDIIELDIRDMSSISDMMIVASGTSQRHVKAIADNVIEKTKAAGFKPLGVEGTDTAEWVLLDLGDVIVHVMLPATRSFYDIEKLWSARPSNEQGEDKHADPTD